MCRWRAHTTNMRARTVLKRREKLISRAITAVKNWMSHRSAEHKFRVAKSTICGRVHRVTHLYYGGKTAFKPEEEEIILELILRHSDGGTHLTRAHVIEGAEIVIENLSDERRKKLPFRNGKPGLRWVRLFYHWNKDALKFIRPNKIGSQRKRAMNAETLTYQF